MSDNPPGSIDASGDSNSAQASTPPIKTRRKRLREFLARVRKSNWLIGILTGIISGILVSDYLSVTGQAFKTGLLDGFTKPSCRNPQWLLQVPDSQVFANAYYMQSDHIPGYGLYHLASNTIDGNLSTSWLQSWPTLTTSLGEGSSDYIEWSFSQPYDVRLICIVDGWTEDANTYKNTLPIGTATVYVTREAVAPTRGSPSISRTCASHQPTFTDYLQEDGAIEFAYQWQSITFHCVTNDIVLHIDSALETSMAFRDSSRYYEEAGPFGYQAPLMGLSEVEFYYCPVILCLLPTS